MFKDDIDAEYILKLFGVASRQMCDELMLFDELFWLLLLPRYAESEPHINGSCGFEDENDFVAFNLPPLIGKQGVHGCNAIKKGDSVTRFVKKFLAFLKASTKTWKWGSGAQ